MVNIMKGTTDLGYAMLTVTVTMEELDDMFGDSFEFSFGGDSKHQSDNYAVPSADDPDEHQFLEEFKSRDEEFLSLMRNYEHLPFKNGAEEARAASIELGGHSKHISKSDIVRLFGYAGGWKIGLLEVEELMRAVGIQPDSEMSAASFQEFLASTSIAKNAADDAFQPKLPSKLNSILVEGFPAKTSVALVTSLCSEHGMIREVKILDDKAKSKKSAPQKFLVTFGDGRSASRAVQHLHEFSSKRIPGPLTCVLCDDRASCVEAIAPDASSSVCMVVAEADATVPTASVSIDGESSAVDARAD